MGPKTSASAKASALAAVTARLDAEIMGATAIKEVMEIAGRKPFAFREALNVGEELVPPLFSKEDSLLQREYQSRDERLYRDQAEAESALAKKVVLPSELVQREITRLERLAGVTGDPNSIDRELQKLEKLQSIFRVRAIDEAIAISRDIHQLPRLAFPQPMMERGVEKIYPFPKGRALRMRVLHPSRPEHISGADVVYEFCDHERRMARFAFIQYKMWDGERIAHSHIKPEQLKKMRSKLCKQAFCEGKHDGRSCFRMPFCSGFLRLTNVLQAEHVRHVSAGRFVPVCRMEIAGRGSISADDIKFQNVSSSIFESCFIGEMVGSDWHPYEAVEKLYLDCEIMHKGDRLLIYASQSTGR